MMGSDLAAVRSSENIGLPEPDSKLPIAEVLPEKLRKK